MDIIKIDASVRSASGKGPAKRLREEGQIPAVAYGKGRSALSVAVSPKALNEILKSQLGRNTVVELGIAGQEKITAMLRDFSVHPVTRAPLHADFVAIKLDEPVDVEVPFEAQGKAAGVVLGGILRQVYRKLPVRCLPEKIPTLIVTDVTHLNLGDHVKVSELKLPEGVTVRLPADQTIAGVVAPEKERPEDVVATGAPAAGAPGAPGAAAPAGGASAAPPAAGAAAPAAAKDAKPAAAAKDKKK